MIMRKIYLLLIYLWMSPEISHAAVFERDWQTPGDGLLTYDDVNNREWLDLSETILDQFPGPGPQTTEYFEARYQAVVAELALGGRFAGFSIANPEDGTALAESAGIDTTTFNYETNNLATNELINLLGSTNGTAGDHISSYGLIDEIDPFRFFPIRSAVRLIIDPPDRPGDGNAGLRFGVNDGFSLSTVGVMLFRNVIPEPSSGSLAVLFLCGIVIATRLDQRHQFRRR